MKRVYCTKCGKCMTHRDRFSLIALDISLDKLDAKYKGFAGEQLGNYKGTENWRWQFCYECCLGALERGEGFVGLASKPEGGK